MITFSGIILFILYTLLGIAVAGLLLFAVVLIIYGISRIYVNNRLSDKEYARYKKTDEEKKERDQQSKALAASTSLQAPLLVWATSVTVALQQFFATAFAIFYEVINLISENRAAFIASFVLSAAAIIIHFYLPEILFVLQLIYNAVGLPIRKIFFYTWNSVALSLDAVFPVWNFIITLVRNTLATLTDTLFRCSDLAFVFSSLGGIFSSLFSDIFTWIGTASNLVNEPLNLNATATAIAKFTESAVIPATCICRDLKPIWVAIDRPLHSPNFALLLTSLINIPISLGQVIANATAYKRPFTLQPFFEEISTVTSSVTLLADDYINSFYFIFVTGDESHTVPSLTSRPYIQSDAEPERLPAIFRPILGNLILIPISFINITSEALINIRGVVGRNDGPVTGGASLNYDPVFNHFYDATWAIQNVSIYLADELKMIDSGEVFLDYVEDILVYAAGIIRHGANSLLLLLQAVYNSVVGVVYSKYDENATIYEILFRIWGYRRVHRGDEIIKIPSPVFNEIRFFSQDVGCLVSFFHEPSGAVIRSALYIVGDFLQIIMQWVITIIQLIAAGNIANAKYEPLDFDILFGDMRTFSGSLGDLIREFSPGCYNIAFNNDVYFGCVICNDTFAIGEDDYNAYCPASFEFTERFASKGQCCVGENDVDAFCAAGNLLDETSLLLAGLVETVVNSTKDVVSFNASQPHDKEKFNQYFEKDIRALSRVFRHFGHTVAYSISDIQVVVDFGPVISSVLNITTVPLWIANNIIKVAASAEDAEMIVTNLITGILSIIFENVVILLNNLSTWAGGFSPSLGKLFFGFANALSQIEGELLTLMADLVQWVFYAVTYFFTGQWIQLIEVTIQFADAFGTFIVQVLTSLATEIYNVIISYFGAIEQFISDICSVVNIVVKVFSPRSTLDCSTAKRSIEINSEAKRIVYDELLIPYGLASSQNGISKCQIIFDGYADTPWHDMRPVEQAEFYSCLESVRWIAEFNSVVSNSTPLPLDLLYNTPQQWRVASSIFKGLVLRTHYTWQTQLYSDSEPLAEYSAQNSLPTPRAGESLSSYYSRNGVEYGDQIEWGIGLMRQALGSFRIFDVDFVKYFSYNEERSTDGSRPYYTMLRRFFQEFKRATEEYERINPPVANLTAARTSVSTKRKYPERPAPVAPKRARTPITRAVQKAILAKMTPQAAENTESVIRFYNRHTKRASCIAESNCADCRVVTDVIDATLDAADGISDYYKYNFTASVAFYDKFFAELNGEPWFGDEETVPKIPQSKVFKNGMVNWQYDLRAIPKSYRIGEGKNKCNYKRAQNSPSNTNSSGGNIITRTEEYVRSIEQFFNITNFTVFIDDISCFLTDPNTSSPESAGYYINALLSCPYSDTTNPHLGIGLLDSILIVYVGLLLLGLFGVLKGTFAIGVWVASPFLVFILAYGFSPACFPAVPVRFVDDLTMILNETLPPCAFANDFNQSEGGSCTAIPPEVKFYSAEQVGFYDWQDNIVFAIQTAFDPKFASSILNGSGAGYRFVEFVLSSDSLERWANTTVPTRTQSDYFWYTFGNFFILFAEIAIAAVAFFLFVVPVASFLVFCVGAVVLNTVILAGEFWAFSRGVFAEESLRTEYTGNKDLSSRQRSPRPSNTKGKAGESAAKVTQRRNNNSKDIEQ